MAGKPVPATAKTGTPLHVHIVGWRGVSHSIALVTQWLTLELLKRPDIRLTFEDAQFASKDWTPQRGVFSDVETDAIAAVPGLAPGERPDISLVIPFERVIYRSVDWPVVGFVAAEHMGPILTKKFGQMAELNDQREILYMAASNWVRDGFVGQGLDQRRIVVLGHGVNVETLAPSARLKAAARAQFRLKGFTFLNVSGMFGVKGIGLLLRAFADLVARGLDVHLLLKGNDSVYTSRKYLEEIAASLSSDVRDMLKNRMTYIGKSMSVLEMSAIYNAADCYVSPYLAEGFNMPVLEAAACGLPIICTGGGATDDFTTDAFRLKIDASPAIADDAWMLYPDLEDLTAKMARVVADPAFRQRAAIAGPRYAAETATWRHIADQLVTILTDWSLRGPRGMKAAE